MLFVLLFWVIVPLMVVWPIMALLVPRFTRPDLFFSITVDLGMRETSCGREILWKFDRAVLFSSLVGLGMILISFSGKLDTSHRTVFLLGGGLLEAIGITSAYARARRQIRPFQVKPSGEREVLVRPRSVPLAGGWLGQLGPFLVLGMAMVCLWWKWDELPARIPVHWGIDMKPNGWAGPGWRPDAGCLLEGWLDLFQSRRSCAMGGKAVRHRLDAQFRQSPFLASDVRHPAIHNDSLGTNAND